MAKTRLAIIISLILIVSGGFLLGSLYKDFSIILKALMVFLSTLLVFLINDSGINKRDTFLLKIIYILIIIADLSLVFYKKAYVGIIVFFFAQSLLIYRNSIYIYSCYSFKETLDKKSCSFLLVLMILLSTYLIFINRNLTEPYLFILFVLYGIVKSLSLFIAVISYRLKVLERINGLLLLLGVIAFYLCDINVGITMVMDESLIKDISGFLIWLFYTPALTMIGLSGYDFTDL